MQAALLGVFLQQLRAILVAQRANRHQRALTQTGAEVRQQASDAIRRLPQAAKGGGIAALTTIQQSQQGDLGVIAQIADDVAVMYLGTIVERGPTREVIRDPQHPYTQGLLDAIPSVDALHERLKPVPGDIPSPNARPTGCPFHPRCSKAMPGVCDTKAPVETSNLPGRSVRCWLYDEKGRNAA